MENGRSLLNTTPKSEDLEMKPSSNDPSDKCDLCGYVPSKPSKATIKIHKDIVHFGVKHYCDHCPQKSTSKSNLSKHIKVCHPEIQAKTLTKNPFSKSLISTKNPKQKKRKIQWFDGCDKNEAHCPCCQQSSKVDNINSELPALKLTNKITNYIETFKCFFCDLVSNDRLSRNIHIEKDHDRKREGCDGIWQYQCNYCPYESKRAYLIYKHEGLGHTGSVSFKCDMCNFDANKKQH